MYTVEQGLKKIKTNTFTEDGVKRRVYLDLILLGLKAWAATARLCSDLSFLVPKVALADLELAP